MADEKEVCNSCIEAVLDEDITGMLTEDEAAEIARDMGGDIPDHDCEEIETDGDEPCGCACHRSIY